MTQTPAVNLGARSRAGPSVACPRRWSRPCPAGVVGQQRQRIRIQRAPMPRSARYFPVLGARVVVKGLRPWVVANGDEDPPVDGMPHPPVRRVPEPDLPGRPEALVTGASPVSANSMFTAGNLSQSSPISRSTSPPRSARYPGTTGRSAHPDVQQEPLDLGVERPQVIGVHPQLPRRTTSPRTTSRQWCRRWRQAGAGGVGRRSTAGSCGRCMLPAAEAAHQPRTEPSGLVGVG